MDQARTTYQSDYTPFDWLQNNVISDMSDFCSSENVDECLKYISQEFSALGYPSIYSNSIDCPSAVNCDIVTFLNTTFELLRRHNEYMQVKEDLESRNQRLCSDLTALNRKNSLLKINLEQAERKLASSLERERQLKGKNEQVSQLLKSEQEETKRLTTQLRQQKVTYQHEIRKYENNMNQIKAKVNQLLSDKNPNKKIVTTTISPTLPRTTGQRGKWKTGTTATSAIEDMYNTVISTYVARCKDLHKELDSFRQSMHSVLLKMLEMVSALQEEVDGKMCSTTSEEFVLNEIKAQSRDIHNFEDKFKCLLSVFQETVFKKSQGVNRNLEDQVAELKSRLSEYEKDKDSPKNSEIQSTNSTSMFPNKQENTKTLDNEFIQRERRKLEAEKKALSKSLEHIEKEKAELSAQKLALLRLAIQQKVPQSSWYEGLNSSPSLSVIASQSGSTKIPCANKIRSSQSTPEQIGQLNRSYSPQCISDDIFNSAVTTQSAVCSPLTEDIKFSNSDLPSWAANKTEVQSIVDDSQNTTLDTSHNVPADSELCSESSSEEIYQMRLKAAMADIENKRTNIS